MAEKSSTHWILIMQVMLLLLLSPKLISASVTSIIVFGDSSVDAGNNNQIQTIARSDFRPYGRDFNGGEATGRFCNGRLSTDIISESFGLKPYIPAYLDPAYGIEDFATGVTFASAGSGYDNATSNVLSVIPLWRQLDLFREFKHRLHIYQGVEKASITLTEALYVMSMGTNDFLENYYTVPGGQSSKFTVDKYEDFLVGIAKNFIAKIYHLGARKIDLTGLNPMGCMPLERATSSGILAGSSCNEDYNKVASDFNGKLQRLVTQLNLELPGIRLVFADIYGIFSAVIDNPTLFGFENVEVGCCATGLFEMGYACNRGSLFTCRDANKYVFWDAFHPTERMYGILAANVMNTSLAQFM